MDILYTKEPKVFIAKKAGKTTGSISKLLGSRIHVDLTQVVDGWAPVTDAPNKDGKVNEGFMQLSQLSILQQLKIFYLDVGQGDATLIEANGAMVLIDCGPNSGLHNHQKKRLKAL